jgi:hypothetical protein
VKGSKAVAEILNRSDPESSLSDSRIWISRIVIAVVLGEAIWGLLVSITNDLALPAMARVMSGDTQSPLYLGKGDFNVRALFTSVLELCFAGIMAVLLNSWSQKARSVQPKAVRRTPVEAPPVSVIAPPAVSQEIPADTTIQAKAPVTTVPSTPQPTPSAPIPKSGKPKPEKVIYYNIVGEPVDDDR